MNNTQSIIIVLMIVYYVYTIYIWPQVFDIHPNSKQISFNDKVVWINTDQIDVMNKMHKEWCHNILIKEAPNTLGIYIKHKEVLKQDVLRQIEIFNMMFKFHANIIYFEHNINKEIIEFCEKKKIKIVNFNLRRTIKI
tara:strand:+ start:742 stop:1155 length:414 start_codon:yes stop_codon:yes gene_type:complete